MGRWGEFYCIKRFEERPERSEKGSNGSNCRKSTPGRGPASVKFLKKECVKGQQKAHVPGIEEPGGIVRRSEQI